MTARSRSCCSPSGTRSCSMRVTADGEGNVRGSGSKHPEAPTRWVWGAFGMPGSVLHELHDLWLEPGRGDEYIGTLVNAYLERGGGSRRSDRAEAYVDVGTLHGYREAVQMLEARLPGGETPPLRTEAGPAPAGRSAPDPTEPRRFRVPATETARAKSPLRPGRDRAADPGARRMVSQHHPFRRPDRPGSLPRRLPRVKWNRFAHAIPADLRGKTVLDIGCNAGFYSIEMKRRGADRVVGIDFDDDYLAQARFAAEVIRVSRHRVPQAFGLQSRGTGRAVRPGPVHGRSLPPAASAPRPGSDPRARDPGSPGLPVDAARQRRRRSARGGLRVLADGHVRPAGISAAALRGESIHAAISPTGGSPTAPAPRRCSGRPGTGSKPIRRRKCTSAAISIRFPISPVPGPCTLRGRRSGMVEAVMLWNEPNNKSHWDFDIDSDWRMFADMINYAAGAVRAMNPDLPIALGGMSPIDADFVRLLDRLRGNRPDGRGRRARISPGLEPLADRRMAGSSPGDPGRDRREAALGVRGWHLHLRSRGSPGMGPPAHGGAPDRPIVPRIHWYSLYDLPKAWPATTRHREAEGSSYYRHFYMGLLREDGTPKLALKHFHDFTPEMGLCQWFHFEDHRLDDAVRRMKDLGVTYLRTGLSWADVYRPGALEWFDRQMKALEPFQRHRHLLLHPGRPGDRSPLHQSAPGSPGVRGLLRMDGQAIRMLRRTGMPAGETDTRSGSEPVHVPEEPVTRHGPSR